MPNRKSDLEYLAKLIINLDADIESLVIRRRLVMGVRAKVLRAKLDHLRGYRSRLLKLYAEYQLYT